MVRLSTKNQNFTDVQPDLEDYFDLSGLSSSSSDSALPEFLIDPASETSESNTTNIFDFATQNESESHGIQINPTEYPKTTTDVYQINMNYSDRSTDVMRYESYRMIKNILVATKNCNLSQSELVIKMLGLVIGMPANSDFGLSNFMFQTHHYWAMMSRPSLLIQYWFSSDGTENRIKPF